MPKTTVNPESSQSATDRIGALLLKAALCGGEHSQEYLLQARSLLFGIPDSASTSDQLNVKWVNSIYAIVEARKSDFSAKDFVSAPEVSPLRDLKSFSVYGLDFKIDPQDQVKLIEVNGINSGMSGFARTGSAAVDEHDHRHRADKALDFHLQQYGKRHLVMIGTLLSQLGMERFRLPIVRDLAVNLLKVRLNQPIDRNVPAPHEGWIKSCFRFVKHLRMLEDFLESKMVTDTLLEPLREFKPKSYPATRKGIADFLANEAEARFAVLKPDGGAQGKGVEVIPCARLREGNIKSNPTYVVEPFVESTPIYCEKTKTAHDGCMRLVVVAERLNDESLRFKHFEGYWRPCPRPIDEYGDLEAMRANLHQAAIPQVAAPAHLEMIKPVAEKIVTVLEGRLCAELQRLQ